MREKRSFTIKGHGDREFVVNELSVGEILDFLQPNRFTDGDFAGYIQFFQKNILPKVTNITPGLLKNMYPSELELVWEKFREANKAFFGLSEALGITGMVEQIKPAICGAFGSYVVGSLSRGMQEHMSTVSHTSLTPSTSSKKQSSKTSQAAPTQQESEPMQTKSSGKSSSEVAA